jgi:hypothetical protein
MICACPANVAGPKRSHFQICILSAVDCLFGEGARHQPRALASFSWNAGSPNLGSRRLVQQLLANLDTSLPSFCDLLVPVRTRQVSPAL